VVRMRVCIDHVTNAHASLRDESDVMIDLANLRVNQCRDMCGITADEIRLTAARGNLLENHLLPPSPGVRGGIAPAAANETRHAQCQPPCLMLRSLKSFRLVSVKRCARRGQATLTISPNRKSGTLQAGNSEQESGSRP